MSDKTSNILEHIFEYCGGIKSSIKRFDDDIEIFLADADYQRSVCFNLLQIGELVKHLPMDFRTRNPQVPWKQICGLRDIVVHAYVDVDLSLIFESCHENIDDLANFCADWLNRNEANNELNDEDEPEFEP